MYRTLASSVLVVFILFLASQPEYYDRFKSKNLLLPCFVVVVIAAWILIEYMQTAKSKRGILEFAVAFSGIFAVIVLPMPFLGITEGKDYSLVVNEITGSHRITQGTFFRFPWEVVSQHPLHPEGSDLLLTLKCPDNFKNIKLSGKVQVRWQNHSPRYPWTNGILSEEYFQCLMDDAVLTTLQILSQSADENVNASFTRELKVSFERRVQDSFLEGEVIELSELKLVVD